MAHRLTSRTQWPLNDVLGDLLHRICQVYLDDIIIFVNSEEELLRRLEDVLKRIRVKGLTANPLKCRLGLSEIDYVSHVINNLGMHFAAEKLDKEYYTSINQQQWPT